MAEGAGVRVSRVVAAVATVLAMLFGLAVPANAATTVSITVNVRDSWGALKTGCVTVKSSLKTAKDCTVNSAGAFTFTGLPKATYTISTSGFANHFDQTLSSKPTFSSKTSYSTTATIKRYGLIKGLVLSTSGAAISGATVTLSKSYSSVSPGAQSTVTAANGAYQFYVPDSAAYFIDVGPVPGFGWAPRGQGIAVSVTAAPNATVQQDVTMAPAGSVSGVLNAPPALTSEIVCVSLHDRNIGRYVGSYCGHRGDTFAIADVPPESFVVCVSEEQPPQICTRDVPGIIELMGETAEFNYSHTLNPAAVKVSSGANTAVEMKWGGRITVPITVDTGEPLKGGCLQATDSAIALDVIDCDPDAGGFTFDIPSDVEDGSLQFQLTGAQNAEDTTWTGYPRLTFGSQQTWPHQAHTNGTGTITLHLGKQGGGSVGSPCVTLFVGLSQHRQVETRCGVGATVVFEGLGESDYTILVSGASGTFSNWWYGGGVGNTIAAATWVKLNDGAHLDLTATLPTTQVLTGTVTAEGGGPLSGGSVELVAEDGTVLASAPVTGGAYVLQVPIADGWLRATGFAGSADAYLGGSYQRPWNRTTLVSQEGATTSTNFVLKPYAELSGSLAAPGTLAGAEVCIQAAESTNQWAYGPSSCGVVGDPFVLPVVPGASYNLCVRAADKPGSCSLNLPSHADRVGPKNSPTSFAVPAGGAVTVSIAFGGTLLVTPTASDPEVVEGGCAALVIDTVAVDSACDRTDGAFVLHSGDDIDYWDNASIIVTGLHAAHDLTIRAGDLFGGDTVVRQGAASPWGKFTGTIKRPAGFSSSTVCATVTNFDGFSATDCALPGDSTYAVPAPSGLYKIEFYAEGPGVATEWYPNKITGGEGEWVRMDYEDTTVNAVLAAAGTIQGFVSGPGGALSSGGCVSVFTVAGLFVDMNCPADGDPFVFNSLTPGSYELQFTGFEGLGSAWSGGTGFGQTRQVSVAAGATTTFNMELSAAAVVTGTVDYSGEPAVGGCVDVVDTSGYTVSTACVDSNGVYTIDDAPGGVVYLHFRGFDGAANEWTGESSSFAKATAVHLHSGSTTTIDATLGRGGTISGEVSEFNGGVFTVFLRALDGSLVDWYSLGGDNYSATFGFNNVPQGRYKLTVIANGTTYETPYRASGAISPAIVSMPTASGWDLTGLNWNTEYDTAGAISGRFNVPSSWKSSTICALAITPKGGVQSADCGARGGRFDLTRLAPDQVYAILFTNGDVHTRAQLKAFKGAKLYYGNTTSLTNALFYRTTVNQAPYLPVWFYQDVSHKTVNIEAIEWLGDQNIYRPSANTFRPESTMTRRDLAMYLYKMAGSPAVAIPSRSPFSDVKTTDAGYKAVLWLRSTKVWTSTAFKPGAGLDKKTEALILYRVAGSPKVTLPSKNPYKDIKSSDSAYKAVTWANKYHIVSKSSSTSFGAKSLVKRKYGAASLYEWWWRFG